MRKFLGTRLGVAVAVALVAVLGATVAVQAALNLSKPMPSTANIQAAVANIEFSQLPTFTSSLTSFDFGDLQQGNTKTITYYIKNNGTYALNNVNATSNLDPAIGTMNFVGLPLTIQPGGVTVALQVILTPTDNGPVGPVTPTITYTAQK